MPKSQSKVGKSWTDTDVSALKKLIKGNTPTRLIAHKLKRSASGVRSKAQDLNVSLKPINRSPYDRKKK